MRRSKTQCVSQRRYDINVVLQQVWVRRVPQIVVQSDQESPKEAKKSLTGAINRFVQLVPPGQVGGLLLMKLDLHDRIGTSFGRVYTRKFCKRYSAKLKRFLPEGAVVLQLTGRRIAIAIIRQSTSEIVDIATSIIGDVEPRIRLGPEKFTVDVSIGAAFYPDHAEDGETLLRRSKLAMQQAIDGGISFALYEEGASGFQKALWKFETELKQAIHAGNLEVFYQPKYSLEERRIVGAEALVRWRNQSGELVPASEFIPAAERSRAITPLTWLVFEQVAQSVERLRCAPRPFAISVNVPAQLLATQEFFERMAKTRNTLKKHHLSLIVELTEDSLMQTDSASLDALKRIRENGVGLAIDDFGKGYSSLNYIRQIPANELKIDRDFVRALLTDQKDHHIVKTAIELAEAFDMQSTAEGVDSIELLLELWKMKCCIIQGFFLARPMKLEALEAWFRNDAVTKFEQLIESERQNSRSGGLGHLAVKS